MTSPAVLLVAFVVHKPSQLTLCSPTLITLLVHYTLPSRPCPFPVYTSFAFSLHGNFPSRSFLGDMRSFRTLSFLSHFILPLSSPSCSLPRVGFWSQYLQLSPSVLIYYTRARCVHRQGYVYHHILGTLFTVHPQSFSFDSSDTRCLCLAYCTVFRTLRLRSVLGLERAV